MKLNNHNLMANTTMKQYTKPATTIEYLLPESNLMSASLKVYNDDLKVVNNGLSNGRRGTWGDLWYDGEE